MGTLTYEYTQGNYSSRATMWTPPGSAVSLHPAGASQSYAYAVDGDAQYGGFYNGASRAALGGWHERVNSLNDGQARPGGVAGEIAVEACFLEEQDPCRSLPRKS